MTGSADVVLRADRDRRANRQRLLYEFNMLPAVYADPSWVEGSGSESRTGTDLPTTVTRNEHAIRIDRSTALLKKHGLSDRFDWSVRSAAVRLALLQRTAFGRLCTMLGIMRAAPELRRTIDGATLRSLDSDFGDLFESIWASESLTLARALPEYSLLKCAEEHRLHHAREHGYRLYRSLLHAEHHARPESIARAQFRLPKALIAEPVAPIDPAVARPVVRWLCQSAVKRWEPTWAWLF